MIGHHLFLELLSLAGLAALIYTRGRWGVRAPPAPVRFASPPLGYGSTYGVTQAPAARMPSVTVIRPIRGLDVGARGNVEALLDLDYRGPLELLFVLDSEQDPAYPLVQELLRQHPTRASRAEVLLAGTPPPGRTGKLNAMITGARAARGEVLAFNDSDTRPTPGLLTRLVSALVRDPAAGSSFAPVFAACEDPSAGDVGYALLVNGWYGASVQAAAKPDGEMPFLMGQFMVFRREALQAIGGLESAQGQFVDDMYLGRRLLEKGWKNLLVREPLQVVTGRMGLWAFLRTFRRWILFSESGLPLEFTLPNWVRGVACWLAWIGTVGGLLTGAWGAVVIGAAALVYATQAQIEAHRAGYGQAIALRHLWIPAVLPLLGAGVALSARLWRKVDWRGRAYDLNAAARLGPGSAPAR